MCHRPSYSLFFVSLAGSVAVALAVTGLIVPASADVPASLRAISSSADEQTRPDPISAMVTAKSLGRQVEDESQRTETTSVFANPDGTWSSDSAPEPVRVQDEAGAWHDVDTTLIPRNGGFGPAYAASDVLLSDGGDRVFASVNQSGKELDWRWRRELPKPIVDGDTATYPGVAAGGDLVVTATATGFTHHIVLKEAPQAPVQFTIPVATDGAELTETVQGGLQIETPSGMTLVSAAAPLMWDSSDGGGGEPEHVAPVDTEIGETPAGVTTVTLAPDSAFLTDPTTAYPVVVDPSFTTYTNGDAWVQNKGFTTGQVSSPELRAGTYDGGDHVARSFIHFSAISSGKWLGKHILSAKLVLRNWYSTSCVDATSRVARIVESWDANGLTWANQPSASTERTADYNRSHGYSAGCPEADATWNITDIVQGWASGEFANNGLRLRAPNETSSNTWRRYRSANYSSQPERPHIAVTYSSYPGQPTRPALTTSPASAAGYSISASPTLNATITDPDGGAVNGIFKISEGSTLIWSGASAAVAEGSTASITVPAGTLLDGHAYTVKVAGDDSTATGPYSSSTRFLVDSSAPIAAVSASAFSEGRWTSSAPTSNIFSFSGPGDTASFTYSLDGVAQPPASAGSNGIATVGWVPKAGFHTVVVAAVDKAGNGGADKSFTFGVGSAAFAVPRSSARSTASFPLQADAPPNATSASLSWRYGDTSPWHDATGVMRSGSPWTGAVTNTSDAAASTTGALLWDATAQNDPATTQLLHAPAILELRACFSYTGITAPSCSPPRQVQLVPSAFGGQFPVATVGSATVALFTGEMTLTEPDAVDSAAGVGRSFASFDAATTETGGPFGPGWSTSLITAGDTDSELLDLRDQDQSFVLLAPGGVSETFLPVDHALDPITATGPVPFARVDVDDGTRLVLDGTTVTLTRPGGGAVTVWAKTSEGWVQRTATPSSVTSSTPETQLVVTKPGFPMWIAEAASDVAATCTESTQTAGCRGLKISYTNNKVSKIERVAADTAPVTLATYEYDSAGRLAQVCDPRPARPLCASYTYTTLDGRTLLSTVTPPGQKAWRFDYDSTGRLSTVKRTLDPGTGTGDATWTVVYDLPTTTAGLPNMTTTARAQWGQDTAPSSAFAVFSPVRVPAGTPTATDLPYASLWYADNDGVTTNTAVYGAGDWLVDTTWWDTHGGEIRSLDGAGRARALQAPAADRAQVAYDASSITIYNDDHDQDSDDGDGRRVEDQYGPVHTVSLADGTSGAFRSHTSYIYDDEAPTLGGGGKPQPFNGETGFDLPVEVRHSAAGPNLFGEYDVTVVRNEYDPIVTGDGNGWELGTPTRVKTRLADGTWSTQVTRYDTHGRYIELRGPGGTAAGDGAGSDAHTTVMSYYMPGASDPACDTTARQKQAWAGLVCKTGPAGQPSGQPIPTTYNAAYNADRQPTRTEENSGTTTRVTTQDYDALGRPTVSTVTLGQESRTTTTGYDFATGLPVSQSGAGGTLSAVYDTWGRLWKYTDASSLTSVTTYTRDSQPSTFNDGVGTYSYAYDGGTGEHRRLPTGVETNAGVTTSANFSLAYDTRGKPTTVTYPNGLTANYRYDEIGVRTGLDYRANGNPLLAFTATANVDGRVLANSSTASQQTYAYDDLGRLTTVHDTRDGQCTTRTYGFNASSERTAYTSYDAAADGSCQITTPSVSRSSVYDEANRLRNTGYTYDDFGRTLSIPAVDTEPGGVSPLTATYHEDDMVASLEQTVDDGAGGSERKAVNYTLDPSGRIDALTSTIDGGETSRVRYRFSDELDSPSSIQTSTDYGLTWTSTRYLKVAGLGMVASVTNGQMTYQLANIHGDAVATQVDQGATSTIDTYAETDEYGSEIESPDRRYGWLGTQQRSTDTVGGLVLMGARVYNPTNGLFLSRDPVLGGGLTWYDYAGSNPINNVDFTGRTAGPWHYEGSFTRYGQWYDYLGGRVLGSQGRGVMVYTWWSRFYYRVKTGHWWAREFSEREQFYLQFRRCLFGFCYVVRWDHIDTHWNHWLSYRRPR